MTGGFDFWGLFALCIHGADEEAAVALRVNKWLVIAMSSWPGLSSYLRY